MVSATPVASAAPSAAPSDAPPAAVPANVRIRFHVNATISSKASKAGTAFAFAMVDPIVVGASTIVARDAIGSGTILVAGHAGNGGHEGDITLRLDTVPAVDGRTLAFDDQRIEINGRNRKIVSTAAGFIPFVGFGSFFIRGSDIEVTPATIEETVLVRAAHEVDAAASPVPSSPASPSPASPSPVATS